jgi:hypothetical protein
MLVVILTFCSSAYGDGLSGQATMNFKSSKQVEDDRKIAGSDMFNQDYYLSLNKPITSLISYQLDLRTRLQDSENTDSGNNITKTYLREVEPSIAFFLQNPVYDLSAGYRRDEQWSTASLENDTRETTEFSFSRLNISPVALPTLSLEINRKRDYDHLAVQEKDRTSTIYSGTSTYELPAEDVKLNYYLTYTHNTEETPINILNKSINTNFAGNYNVGYTAMFGAGKVILSVSDQGNFTRNKSEQFVTQKGSVLFERTPYFGGLYIYNTTPENDALNSEPLLINGDYNDSPGIKLNTSFQNIGIWITSKTVNRIDIYYKNDGVAEPITWRIYRSNNNLNWTFMTETTVNPIVDSENNVYRYEIKFPAASASYFKAVNVNAVSQVSGSDVEVTEIRAYGTDEVPQTGILIDVSKFYSQQLNFIGGYTPIKKLKFSLNYSINRTDQGSVEFFDSVGGLFKNIISKDTTYDKDDVLSNILRSYSGSAAWVVDPKITATLRLQRNENFDNTEETDATSNTYSLSFASSPLPTLDTNLSLIKRDKYSFSEKESTHKSLLINIGSRLYQDVNMITDIAYSRTLSFVTNTKTTNLSISGFVDAVLTRKLSTDLRYNLSRTVSDDKLSISKEGTASVVYRPGRFINLSGNFHISHTDGNTSTAQVLLIDWLPLPVIRLNLNYQHSISEPGPSTIDSIFGYGMWYITKFLSLQLIQGYTRNKEEKITENYNIGANLNCRF